MCWNWSEMKFSRQIFITPLWRHRLHQEFYPVVSDVNGESFEGETFEFQF
jgi:hypothetical protein